MGIVSEHDQLAVVPRQCLVLYFTASNEAELGQQLQAEYQEVVSKTAA